MDLALEHLGGGLFHLVGSGNNPRIHLVCPLRGDERRNLGDGIDV